MVTKMIMSTLDQIKVFLEKIMCKDKTVIACVGSPLRSDDRLGLLIYDKIKDLANNNISIIECEYGLENCFTEIVAENPATLLIIDAVYNESLNPGTMVLTSIENIREKISLATTHTIPLRMILELIMKKTNIKNTYILGIRAKNLDIGMHVSPEIKKVVEDLAKILKEIITSCGK